MTTLIVASSHHGSTREIAERVAEILRTRQSVETVVEDPAGAGRWLDSADAVIVAAPVYSGALDPAAKRFLDTRRAELSLRPLLILTSGGGLELPPKVQAQLDTYDAREVVFFRGAVIEQRLTWVERMKLKRTKKEIYGDFRDWDAIEHWAGSLSSHGVR